MNFEKQYLTYEQYREMGGSKDKASFDLLEFNARQIIKKRTLNRLDNCKNYDYEVKICVYNLINAMSIDGNYLDGTIEDKRKIENDIIDNALMYYIYNGVPVLYLGIN